MKSDVGAYSYDPEHPHAVLSAGAGMYGYDKVGNQTDRPDLTIAYTPFDLPSKYTRKADGAETTLEYDGDQPRVRKTTTADETLYFGEYERVTSLAAPSSVEFFLQQRGFAQHRIHVTLHRRDTRRLGPCRVLTAAIARPPRPRAPAPSRAAARPRDLHAVACWLEIFLPSTRTARGQARRREGTR